MTQVLAIDQGTTNSKAVLVDDGGVVRAVGSAPAGDQRTRVRDGSSRTPSSSGPAC